MKINLNKFIFFSVTLWLFVLSFLFGKEYLPRKYWHDSDKIKSIVSGVNVLDGSFESTAKFLYFYGDFGALIITFLLGVLYVYYLSKSSGQYITAFSNFIFFIPALLLNLLWPAKETIVILSTILVVASYYFSSKKDFVVLIVVFIVYIAYAYNFRTYYFLIVLVFFYLYIVQTFTKISLGKSLFILFLMFGFLPNEFYLLSQGQRDSANVFAEMVGSDNRTAFNNLFPLGGFLNFWGNYIWAALHTFFPILFFRSINEFILLAFNFYCYLCVFKSSKDAESSKILRLLFVSHIAVLILFEPDIGSFFRHSLSAYLYLITDVYFKFNKKVKL